jgi:hypothetical protein
MNERQDGEISVCANTINSTMYNPSEDLHRRTNADDAFRELALCGDEDILQPTHGGDNRDRHGEIKDQFEKPTGCGAGARFYASSAPSVSSRQRCPALRPNSGSRSRNNSFQSCSALLALE